MELSAAGSVKRCTFTITGTSQNDHAAIKTTSSSGGTIEGNTISFASGLSHTRRGIEIPYGNATVLSNAVTNANRGVSVAGGSNTFRYNILEACTDGFYFESGAGGNQTIDRNTVFRADASCPSGSCGILLASGSMYPTTVSNNLFINLETGINCSGTTGGTYTHNIYARRSCTSGSASDCSLTSSEIAVKECLLCEGRESSVEYFTQRIDSEAAQGNNGWNEVVGAKDVQCAWGTLARSSVLPSGSSVIGLEDVIVPSGTTLTLDAGSSMAFDAYDDSQIGEDIVSLTVDGVLRVNGTSGSPVVLEQADAGHEWQGVTVNLGGKAFVAHAEIEGGEYGFVSASSDTVIVEDSVFAENEDVDIHLAGDPSRALIDGNTLTPEVTGILVACSDRSGVTISNNTITGSATALAGIKVYAGSATGAALVESNTITDFSAGAGILIVNGTSDFLGNTVADNKYGFHVTGTSGSSTTPNIGTTSSSSDNIITGNTRGIFVQATGNSTCYSCNDICPVIRNNSIQSNTTGVYTEKTIAANLGTNATSDAGKNTFLSNTSYCIRNAASSSCGNVIAVGNYFGDVSPCDPYTLPTCGQGNLTLMPVLCTAPAGAGRGVEVGPVAPPAGPARLLALRPNPLVSTTTVQFEILGRPRVVDVGVFDLTGRLIRRVTRRSFGVGVHDVDWDGRRADGSVAPSGLYFVRLTSPDGFAASRKLVVAR